MSGSVTISDTNDDGPGYEPTQEDFADLNGMVKAHDLYHVFMALNNLGPLGVDFTDPAFIESLDPGAWNLILELTGRNAAEHMPSERKLHRLAAMVRLYPVESDCGLHRGGTPSSGPLR